jgi:Zn-dependent protease
VNSPLNLLFERPEAFVVLILALVVSITVHEFCHAAVATAQGDHTARDAGRLTLNPIRHLDPWGSILMVLAGFGWGKPVPFLPSALRSRRFGAALVSLAGPLSNFVLALLSALALRWYLFSGAGGRNPELTFMLLETFFSINVILGVFNLIPVPPLDGSRLLSVLLPPNRQGIVYWLDRYGVYLLLGLILLPALNPSLNWMSPLFARVQDFFLGLVGLGV